MNAPKWLISTIVILAAAVIIAAASLLPNILKESHARNFANTQAKYMQSELAKGESVEKVKALTQAHITNEQLNDTGTEYTRYAIVIDEEKKACRIDVEYSHGKYKRFSTDELLY